eukprot:1441831-Rhodomonas_salina.1
MHASANTSIHRGRHAPPPAAGPWRIGAATMRKISGRTSRPARPSRRNSRSHTPRAYLMEGSLEVGVQGAKGPAWQGPGREFRVRGSEI